MTPQMLRHTFCTNLANAGVNPKALQYIMGHSNSSIYKNRFPTLISAQEYCAIYSP